MGVDVRSLGADEYSEIEMESIKGKKDQLNLIGPISE